MRINLIAVVLSVKFLHLICGFKSSGSLGWIEFESAHKLVMNLIFECVNFQNSMNLNVDFKKSMNLILIFAESMNLNLKIKIKMIGSNPDSW